MRKIATLLSAAALALCAFGASAETATTTINVDDPARVSVTLDGVDQALVAGDNVFSVTDASAAVRIQAREGNLLLSVTQHDSWGDSQCYISDNAYSYQLDSSYSWALNTSYSVVSADLATFRTASCVVTVTDDPAAVRLRRDKDTENYPLQLGDNTVTFNPEYEKLSFCPSDDMASLPLYEVLLNGVAVAPNSSYSNNTTVEAKDGDKISVTANWPDTQCHVGFVFPDGTDPAIVAGVFNADSDQPYEFSEQGFDVKCGTRVTVRLNDLYEVSQVLVNGVAEELYGSSSFSTLVARDGEMSFTGTPCELIHATLNIDDPERVIVYRGSQWNGVRLSGLVAGDNDVVVTPNNSRIVVSPAEGCYLVSVTDDTDMDWMDGAWDQNSIDVDITPALVVTVKTAKKVRDQRMVFFAQGVDGNTGYQGNRRNDGSQFEIHDGYTLVPFNVDTELPLGVSLSSNKNTTQIMMLNDQLVEYMWGWEFEPADGDVAYIFVYVEGEDYEEGNEPTEAPAKVSVSFEDAPEGAQVVRDLIVPVSDLASGFEAYPGTQFTISGAGDKVVTVNGQAVEPQEDGSYLVTVPAQGAAVAFGSAVGVEDVAAGIRGASTGIYNLQGMRMNMTEGQLPRGIYIINGKKVAK